MKLLSEEEIKQVQDEVISQAYVKGCPNSPSEWFVSTEKLLPLRGKAIAGAQARLTHSEIVEWLKERNHGFEGRLFIIKIDFDEWSDFQLGKYE